MLATFATSHNEAFRALGAVKPNQHWSAFDVPRPQARAGKAKRFVTTIWNFHRKPDAQGRRIPTKQRAIAKDKTDGTLWYKVTEPPAGTPRKTWVAHWGALRLALTNGIPIVGVLKDVHSKRCSLEHVFDCGSHRKAVDGSGIWLQLTPRGQVGCEVGAVDIRQVTAQDTEVSGAERMRTRIARTTPRPWSRRGNDHPHDKRLGTFDEAERKATTKSKTIMYRNRHNRMTNALRRLWIGYRLLAGSEQHGRYDVLVKDYDGRGRDLLIEAKPDPDKGGIRIAIGQLFDYRRFLPDSAGTDLAVLTISPPEKTYRELLLNLQISALWFTNEKCKRICGEGKVWGTLSRFRG